jgi:hypothetical protein
VWLGRRSGSRLSVHLLDASSVIASLRIVTGDAHCLNRDRRCALLVSIRSALWLSATSLNTSRKRRPRDGSFNTSTVSVPGCSLQGSSYQIAVDFVSPPRLPVPHYGPACDQPCGTPHLMTLHAVWTLVSCAPLRHCRVCACAWIGPPTARGPACREGKRGRLRSEGVSWHCSACGVPIALRAIGSRRRECTDRIRYWALPLRPAAVWHTVMIAPHGARTGCAGGAYERKS